MDAILGRKLKASRIEAGFNLPRDIAPKVGRSSRHVQNYENGVVPPADVLLKWAEAVGKPVEYFLPQAKAELTATTEHPGLDQLSKDTALRARHRIDDAELEVVREWVTGHSIPTKELALAFLLALRSEGP